jgi:hypothetical protein
MEKTVYETIRKYGKRAAFWGAAALAFVPAWFAYDVHMTKRSMERDIAGVKEEIEVMKSLNKGLEESNEIADGLIGIYRNGSLLRKRGNGRRFLPIQTDSYKDDSGAVIIPQKSLFEFGDGKIRLRIAQKGDFDLIGVKTSKGYFMGMPGENIYVELSIKEFSDLLEYKEVPLDVVGMDMEGGCLTQKESYKAFFRIEKDKSLMKEEDFNHKHREYFEAHDIG